MRFRVGKRQAISVAAVWLLLLLSFYANFFGVGLNKEWFAYFQEDSSLITEKTAQCKGELTYDGPVIAGDYNQYMHIMGSSSCDMTDLKPYDSQYGMQARLITLFAPMNDDQLPRYFKFVELVLASLTALLLTMVVVWAGRRYGIVTAIVLTALLALSPWLAGYARNMYWIEPLMLAPFVLSLLFYPWFKERRKLWIFYVIESLLLFLKFTNGYEHASTLMISVLVPIVFYEVVELKRRIFSLWKEAMIVAAIGVVAFFGAFFVNVASLANYYDSWQEAVQQVKSRSTARSLAGLQYTQPDVILNFRATLPDAYTFVNQFVDMEGLIDGRGAMYKYAAISAINYLLLPAISMPFTLSGMLGVVLQSVATFAILGLLSIWKILHSQKYKAHAGAFWYSYWLSLAGALSWPILMPAHAYPHAHLNAIIFYMPFLLICYVVIGLVIQEYVAPRFRQKGGR